MRALGIDLGTKRIGIALSDRSGLIASPYSVIIRTSKRRDWAEIARIATDEDVETIVIGLPLSLSGHEGPAAVSARRDADEIGTVTGVPVILFDERLTTVAADRVLKEADVRASDRRRHVDKVAAAIMLQAWLDSR